MYSQTYPSDALSSGAAAGLFAFMGFMWLIGLALAIVVIAGMWMVFVKAGKPGWAAIIPIYNFYVLLEIVGRPTWWLAFLLLLLIPGLGQLAVLVVLIIVYNDLSKSFGQSVGFTVGLVLLGFIFWPILGFGSSRYIGPMATGFGNPPVAGGYGGPGTGYGAPGGGYTPPTYTPPATPPAPPAYAPPTAPAPATPPYEQPPAYTPPAPPAAPVAPPAEPAAAPAPESVIVPPVAEPTAAPAPAAEPQPTEPPTVPPDAPQGPQTPPPAPPA